MARKRKGDVRFPLGIDEILIREIPARGALGPAGVHRARRALKRARALLRIAERAEIEGARELRHRAAQITRELSPMRDATIAARGARFLADKTSGDARKVALRVARLPMPKRSDAWWAGWHRRRRALALAISALDVPTGGTGDLRGTLRHSARKAIRSGHAVGTRSDLEKIHEWSKRIVVLRELLAATEPALGRRVRRLHERIDRLADRIGKVTDYRPMVDALRKSGTPKGAAADRLRRAADKDARNSLKSALKRWERDRRRLKRLAR